MQEDLPGNDMGIDKQVLADRDYWKQFEHGDWTLRGFTERDSASFRNAAGRSVQVTGEYMDFFGTMMLPRSPSPDPTFSYGLKPKYDPNNPWRS